MKTVLLSSLMIFAVLGLSGCADTTDEAAMRGVAPSTSPMTATTDSSLAYSDDAYEPYEGSTSYEDYEDYQDFKEYQAYKEREAYEEYGYDDDDYEYYAYDDNTYGDYESYGH